MRPNHDLDVACRELASADPVLGGLMKSVGPCGWKRLRERAPFNALARSIVYQQLSGKAAATIHGRLIALFPEGFSPEALLATSEAALRGAGLSRGKLAALRDLAAKSLDGTVPTAAKLARLGDAEVIERLTEVRGVGRWTVEMYLMFGLGRPDVLPVGDLGVRKGFKVAYRKRQLPSPERLAKHGETWRPWRTVASWYLWRAAEGENPDW
jgi:DNA-3-methyladenine glycosylase II